MAGTPMTNPLTTDNLAFPQEGDTLKNRPASYADFQRAVACGQDAFPRRKGLKPVRVGPWSPCFGPLVRKAGAPRTTGSVLIPSPARSLPPDCPTSPPPSQERLLLQDDVRRGMLDALFQAPPIIARPGPQQDPDATGRSQLVVPPGGLVVVGNGAAGDALRTGIAGPPGPAAVGIPALVTFTATVPTTIFSVPSPGDSRAFVARQFRVDCSEPSAFVVLQFAIFVSGEQVVPWFNASDGVWFPINISADPGKSIDIAIINADQNSNYILYPKVSGWTMPIVGLDGTLSSRIRRNDPRNPI